MVYDVKGLRASHPGGETVLWKAVGRDATAMFQTAGHSADAKIIMLNCLVGRIDPNDPSSVLPQESPIGAGKEESVKE
jgi:cytochrome b involved in lipid metabolism